MIRVLFGVLLAVAAWGQAPRAVQPEDRCTVEGQIVNAITGEPIKKADLILTLAKAPGTRYGAISDAGGKFIFYGIDPGKYRLIAERTGFIRRAYNARDPNGAGQLLTLSARGKLTGLLFKLTPQSAVSGRVIDEDGDPMAEVDVRPYQYGYVQGKKQLWPISSGASTDDRGEYRIFGLAAGKYFLLATYRDDRRMERKNASLAGSAGAPRRGYAPTYYPGTIDSSNAAALTLTPGMEMRGMDIKLVKTSAVHIRGAVSYDGKVPREVTVLLLSHAGRVGFSRPFGAIPDAQGRFEIRGVTPGSYFFVANFTSNGVQYSARQEIEVGNSNINGVRIALAAPVALLAHVRVEGGAPVQFNQIRVLLDSTSSPGGGYGPRRIATGT